MESLEERLRLKKGRTTKKRRGKLSIDYQSRTLEFMTTETGQANAQTSISVVAAIAPTPSVVTVPVNHSEKLEKFSRIDFKIWQQKILLYLTTLNLARFLREDVPILKEDETDRQVVVTVDAWKHADFVC
ncbi:uncharacterized protein LOC114289825 [Camellia sinensis]|uniref:uncharacterized protein LOC114289825 n=1 Tax=Camellia sinensis TaxID=4442 RepID=UPI001036B0EC|nr:uncharacterized protein LOC114289825 [Camellia sinensis]